MSNMAFFKEAFVIFVICVFQFFNHVSALKEEAIVNGIPVRTASYTYHVAVIAMHDGLTGYTILGGGALISKKHIASASILFLTANGELQPLMFGAMIRPNSLNEPNIEQVLILQIFFTEFDPTFVYSNLAVAELVREVDFGQEPIIKQLKLPKLNSEQVADSVVTGFGYYVVDTEPDPRFPEPIVTDGTLSSILRYRRVQTLTDTACGTQYPSNVTPTNLCGVMRRQYDIEEIVGICSGDYGNPLTKELRKDRMLIGIASVLTPNCDNTSKPSLYMKVSYFISEIKNFMNRVLPPGTFVRQNNVF